MNIGDEADVITSEVRLSHVERVLDAIESNFPILYALVCLLQNNIRIGIVKLGKSTEAKAEAASRPAVNSF